MSGSAGIQLGGNFTDGELAKRSRNERRRWTISGVVSVSVGCGFGSRRGKMRVMGPGV